MWNYVDFNMMNLRRLKFALSHKGLGSAQRGLWVMVGM